MAAYYDPMFYLCSEEMPFSIRIEIRLREPVEETALQTAVRTAIKRYPYFAVQLREQDGEIITVPNERDIPVILGQEVLVLGSKEVNYHLLAFSWEDREISFHISHVLTDGAGFFPFIRTVLYYYFCSQLKRELKPTDVRLCDDPFYADELGNPFPEELMASATPLSVPRQGSFFRLRDGGYVTDKKRMAYRVSLSEKELLQFGRDHDGSPCSAVSSLMTMAVWELHPTLKEDVISAISFNMRPGLRNGYSYRMLCSALNIRYPARLRGSDVRKLCTCTRGAVTLQSQEENVLFAARKRREQLETLLQIPGVEAKHRLLAPLALRDATENTFSVSYVGMAMLGEAEQYVDSIYNFTDGSTYETLFLEIANLNDEFDIAFLQGFSSDVYFRGFLRQLDAHGLSYRVGESGPFRTAGLQLPDRDRPFAGMS